MKGLAAAAPRNVIFTGKVDPDVANLYINAADVCLLPVKKIRVSPGSPSKLFDYIAAGRPVVTQEATTGYSDIVLSYELGYAIDFCDSASAAEKIVAIVKQCHETHYETHNRQVALTHLNWSNVADKWSSFIDKVVST
jgi:glycosyltransferase involved in cell wall biosynthesis